MVDPGRRFVVVPQQRSASIASSKMSPPLTKCKSQKLQKFSFLPKTKTIDSLEMVTLNGY